MDLDAPRDQVVDDPDRDEPHPDVDERIELSDLDPEAWRPGIPWLPSFGLVLALLALPILTLVLAGNAGDGLRDDGSGWLWLVDAWRGLAIGALVVGAGLVLAAPIAARWARHRPDRSFVVLERGLPIGIVLVAILVAAHGLLAAGVVLAVERAVLGFSITATAAVPGFGGLAGAVYVAGTGVAALARRTGVEPGVRLSTADAPGLFARVRELAGRIGVEPPDEILASAAMADWIGDGPVQALDGEVHGRVLHLSLPGLAMIRPAEADAILAHELGHIRNGDTVIGARLAPAFDRLHAAIQTLDRESEGVARLAARPGIRWLEFAAAAMGASIAETRRSSELAADQVAAGAVGPEAVARALVASHAVDLLEDGWAEELSTAIDQAESGAPGDGGSGERFDPLVAFGRQARESLAQASAYDVLIESLTDIGPWHPALLARVRTLGFDEPPLVLAESPAESALGAWVGPADALVRRLVRALRSPADDVGRLHLNQPRVTPGIVAWLLAGVVFAAIFAVRLAQGTPGDWLAIVALAAVAWLAFPVVYGWLQREMIVEPRVIRARPWLWRRLDPEARRRGWRELRWTDQMELRIAFEGVATLSNGQERLRWWGGIWPKQELGRLVDALRERGATVSISDNAGVSDPERHAVLWYVADRFLVPEVRRNANGTLVETKPVKSFGAGTLKLSFALVDRLQYAVEAVDHHTEPAPPSHLATMVGLTETRFLDEARRVAIDADRETLVVHLSDTDDSWAFERKVDEADLAEALFDILGIPQRVRGPRRTDSRGSG